MKRLWEKIVSLSGSNLGLKALALIIAMGLWLAGHRDIERAIEVPVEFRNIPSDLMVLDNHVDFVVLRLSGPRTLVSTIDSNEMKLALDLKGAKPGLASYPLGSSSFNIPRGVTTARITPPAINLRLEPAAQRMLPVTVRFSGKPPSGYRIAAIAVQPERVSVRGPAEEMRRLTSVETVPVDIEESPGGFKRKVRLSSDGKPLSFSPDQVELSFSLEEESVARRFPRVAVRAKDFTGAYSVDPPSVYFRLSGPKRILEKIELGVNQVSLNLKGRKAGVYNMPLTFSLPPEIQVVEQKPQRFRVHITRVGR